MPGKRVGRFTIEELDARDSIAYSNVVVMCGINNLKQPSIRNNCDVRACFDTLCCKIREIQQLNGRASVFICPILPTKSHDLNRRAKFFNHLIFTELLPCNLSLMLVTGFGDFLDQNGLLAGEFANQNPRDHLHLNYSRGAAVLASCIKSAIFLRLNGGVDKRKRTSFVRPGVSYGNRAASGSRRMSSPSRGDFRP